MVIPISASSFQTPTSNSFPKLVKCREEIANLKEDLSKKDSVNKALIAENKQHAQEIKLLKIHLHSQRETVVEKAVVKDELLAAKAELEKRSDELDKAGVRLFSRRLQGIGRDFGDQRRG